MKKMITMLFALTILLTACVEEERPLTEYKGNFKEMVTKVVPVERGNEVVIRFAPVAHQDTLEEVGVREVVSTKVAVFVNDKEISSIYDRMSEEVKFSVNEYLEPDAVHLVVRLETTYSADYGEIFLEDHPDPRFFQYEMVERKVDTPAQW